MIFLLFSFILFEIFACEKNDKNVFEYGENALNHGEYELAITSFQRIIKEFPDSKFKEQALFKLGKIYSNFNINLENAIEFYSQLIFEFPNGKFVCLARKNLVDIYIGKYREYDRAIEELQKISLKCNEKNYKAYSQKRIGDCYYLKRNYQQAIIEYQTVELKFSDSKYRKPALKAIGNCNFIIGNMAEAEADYRKYLSLFTQENNETVKISLAQTLLNQKKFCAALEIYKGLYIKNPSRKDITLMYKKAKKQCSSK